MVQGRGLQRATIGQRAVDRGRLSVGEVIGRRYQVKGQTIGARYQGQDEGRQAEVGEPPGEQVLASIQPPPTLSKNLTFEHGQVFSASKNLTFEHFASSFIDTPFSPRSHLTQIISVRGTDIFDLTKRISENFA